MTNVDQKMALMSESRRRHTLYCLLSNDMTNIDTLSVQIAAWEQDDTISSVSEKAQEAVKIALHHNHLPKLIEARVVEYDARSGDIVTDDGFDEIQSVVEQYRAEEDEMDIEESLQPSTNDGDLYSPTTTSSERTET